MPATRCCGDGRALPLAARDGDELARVGGDEFIAVIPTQGSATVAADVASRLNATCQEPVDVGGHAVPLTVSIGISLAPDDGRTAEELIASADVAMYEAKRSRKRVPQRYAEEFKFEAHRRFDLHSKLRTAFDRGGVHRALPTGGRAGQRTRVRNRGARALVRPRARAALSGRVPLRRGRLGSDATLQRAGSADGLPRQRPA